MSGTPGLPEPSNRTIAARLAAAEVRLDDLEGLPAAGSTGATTGDGLIHLAEVLRPIAAACATTIAAEAPSPPDLGAAQEVTASLLWLEQFAENATPEQQVALFDVKLHLEGLRDRLAAGASQEEV
jgi:hypothetical protein